jgi:hypothetical protein
MYPKNHSEAFQMADPRPEQKYLDAAMRAYRFKRPGILDYALRLLLIVMAAWLYALTTAALLKYLGS